MLTGSGVDEAWTTGTQLGEAVIELLRERKPFTKENLDATYVRRRRASWVEEEGRVAEKRPRRLPVELHGGLVGMALAGFTKGRVAFPGRPLPTHKRLMSAEQFFAGRLTAAQIEAVRSECKEKGSALHDALMEAADGRRSLTTASCW